MNYNSLFNLLYSTEISEATKEDIINKIQEPIIESCEVEPLVETYVELLDTLVYSTASESLIYNIIDETFSQLSEETINEVSDEWIKRKTEAGLKSREKAYNQAKGNIVGLSSLNRASKAGERLERGREQVASRAPRPNNGGALSKLKSAVGKVKSFASSVDKGPEHIGLSRLIGAKANKDNVGAETLRQQTTHKAEAPAENKSSAEAPKAESNSDAVAKAVRRNQSKTEKNRAYKIRKAINKAKGTKLPSGETIEMGNTSIAKREAAREKAKGTKIPSGETIEMDNSEIKGRKERLERVKEKAKGTKIPSGETIELGTSKRKRGRRKTTGTQNQEPIQQKLDLEAPKTEEKQPEVKAEVKADDATKATTKGTTGKKNSRGRKGKKTPTVDSDATAAKKVVTSAISNKEEQAEAPKEEPKAQPAAEAPKEEPKIKVDLNKTGEAKRRDAAMRRQIETQRKDQEKQLEALKQRKQDMTSKPGYDQNSVVDLEKRISDLEKRLGKSKVNEALADLALLLLGTNISESCFMEVMEMAGATKANAEKVKNRYEDEVKASIDALYKDVEEGKPVDPEKVKDAEEKRKRKEHFEKMFNDKFNNNK